MKKGEDDKIRKTMKKLLEFNKLSENATFPVRSSKEAAGVDLFSAYNYVIPARGRCLVKTDLTVCLPEETYGRIAPRSGLAWNAGLDVGAGVVDRDYTGNIKIVLFNHDNVDYLLEKGDKVAQFIVERIYILDLGKNVIERKTERGKQGFGSTGK